VFGSRRRRKRNENEKKRNGREERVGERREKVLGVRVFQAVACLRKRN
jgi:hypothetical protein